MLKKSGVIILLLLCVFIVLALIKWNSLQEQTEMDPIEEPRWLLFHSTSCEACEEMVSLSSNLKEEYKGRVEFINVEISDVSNEKVVKQYKVNFIPTSVFEVKGKEAITRIGAISEDELRVILDNMVKENE